MASSVPGVARDKIRISRARRKSLLVVCIVAVFVRVVKGDPAGFSDFRFTLEPSDTVALKDQSATLNCSVAGDSVNIEWKRDRLFLPLGADARRSILSNGTLYFKTVHHTRTERPDEGIYQCVATRENVGTIVSRAAKLQVASLPRFDEQPQDVSVFPGQTVRFPCAVQGIPPATISWLKNEKSLDIDESRMVVLPSGALEIDHVEVGDKGLYRCNASNAEKHRISDGGNLVIVINTAQSNKIAAPVFIATPKSTITLEDFSTTLECAANGNPRPRITWLKDGATVDLADLDGRFSIMGTGSLHIDHVQESDEGVYMCRAENYEDSLDASASLEVQVPPRFQKEPEDQYAHEKGDVEFDCQIYGKPEPTVQWVKNGDLIIESEYFQIVNGNNLKILGLVSSDVGIYQCFGVNPAGNIQSSAQLVVVKPGVALPSPSITSPNTNDAVGGSPTKEGPTAPRILTAVIVSTRFVTLSWREPAHTSGKILAYSVYYRQDGSQRERVVNTTRSRLEEVNIQGLRPSSKYHFRVVAYNEHGPGESSEELSVETQPEVHVPGPPLNLRAIATSATAILVQWDPPDHRNGPIQRYKLYYMELGTSEEHETQTSESSYELRGLKKYTEYSFWVVAYNENGPGMSTDEVVARTFSDVPSETPQNVTLEAASSTSVIVRWEPPPKWSQNGVITGYKIRYKQKGSRRGDTVTTDGNRRLYALVGLERGAEYSVRMSASTVNGSGPVTDWMVIETYQNDLDESRVPDPPGSLKARPSASAITVSWTPPRNQNIMVRGYTIGWGVGIPDVYTKLVDGKQRFHTIESLQPSSEYVISLRAFNQMGDGHPIYETVKTRIETTPEPLTPLLTPMGLKAIVLSATTVVLYWTDNSLPSNQVINDYRYYTIRYTNQHHASNPRYKYYNATDLNCMIDELKPNTEYEFMVKVNKGRRESHWSLSVRNTTFEAAPTTSPRDVTVVADEKSATAVNVNWQPPKQANGQITGYVISYTTDESLQDWVMEDVDGAKLTTTIAGLTPETKYHFKIQARNRKGYSPPSQMVVFVTGTSSGLDSGILDEAKAANGQGSDTGMPTLYVIIIIAVVCAILLIAIAGAVLRTCRRNNGIIAEHKKKGYGKAKGGKTDVKPPDLWIHHDQMELKQLEKSQNSETSTSVTPLTRNSQDFDSDEKPRHDTLERKGTYLGDSLNDDSYTSSNKSSLARRGLRPKPIMIPVDCQKPPPREPIATATSLPNGSLQQLPHSDRDVQTLTRPMYPRTQYNIPRAHVTLDPSQAGTISPSPELPSPGTYNQQIPMPYEQVAGPPPILPPGAACGTGQVASYNPPAPPSAGDSGTLGKRPVGHPLKSFSVPAPPPQSTPTTPQPRHVAVRPPQASSPYKKSSTLPASSIPTPTSSATLKARSAVPVVAPRAPSDGAFKAGRDDELAPSYSTEELNAEMANLEGLMKDLNAITASEFEC